MNVLIWVLPSMSPHMLVKNTFTDEGLFTITVLILILLPGTGPNWSTHFYAYIICYEIFSTFFQFDFTCNLLVHLYLYLIICHFLQNVTASFLSSFLNI